MTKMKTIALLCGFLFTATSVLAQQTENLSFTGDLSGNVISGSLSLQVNNGQVSQGSGFLTVPAFMLYNASLVLITPSTPGNYPDQGYPVGFRDNSGGDILGDTAFPLTAGGLVFNVGTMVAERSAFPLFNVGSNGDGTFYSLFDGTVNGTVFYAQQGTVKFTAALATPGPLAGAGIVPLLGLAGAMVARRRRENIAA